MNTISSTTTLSTSVRDKLREYLLAAQALLDSMEATRRSDSENIWKYAAFRTFMRKYNQLANAVSQVTPIETIIDLYNIDAVPGSHDTTAIHQKEFFDSVHANLSILKSFIENKIGLKADRIQGLSDFFQVNLRKAIFSLPEREVEVQNAIEQLLIGRGLEKGIDYDRETGRVKVSIKEVVPDFILPKLGLAIEVKLSKDRGKSKAIVDEINADIMAYGKDYSSILFVVYDLGTIRDELEFKRDLEKTDVVAVIIVKH